jgi:hypothetical protein
MNKYKKFSSNLKGGMETGEASPPSTPTRRTPTRHTPTRHTPTRRTPTRRTPTRHTPTRHTPTRHTPTRHTPTRHTPTRHTPTRHTPHSKKSIHIPPMTFKTLQTPKNRKLKVPSIVHGIMYSLPPSHKTKMDEKYHLVCSIDLSEYENRPYPPSRSGYTLGSMISLRNKPSSRETVNSFNLFMLVNKTVNGRVLYDNPQNITNDLADFTLECKDGREIVRQNDKKSYNGASITCFAWDKNNPNHLFIMGRGTNMMREFNNCLLRKFDYTNPDNPNPISATKRFINKADDIFKFAINPNPDMDEIVVLEYKPRQILFHVYRKSDLTHLREFVCEELGKLIPSFIIDNTGRHLIVADAENSRIQVFQLNDGTYVRTIGPPPNLNSSAVSRYEPGSLALGLMNDLIVTSNTTKCVDIFSYSDGYHIMTIQSSPDESPLHVTADENGKFFVFYKGPDTSIIKIFQNTILKYKFNRMI